MVRNRNGYWMDKRFLLHPDPDGNLGGGGEVGGGGATGAPAGGDPGQGTPGGEGTPPAGEGEKKADDGESVASLKAKIAQYEAKQLKDKEAIDKATHEASEARKALREKMTQEELNAEAKKEAEEKQAQELDDLRKKVARSETAKSIMGTIGLSEDDSGTLADCLYGAADVKNALLLIQKAWQAKEKALKLEYGKITPPGAGTDSNSPEAQAIKRAQEIGKAKNAQNEQAQKAINAYIR